jgi:hypothetical protein
MGQRVAGTVYVKVDGQQLTIEGGVEAPLSDKERETLVPGFFSEKDLTPYINMDALHTPDFPLEKLVNGTDMTVMAEFKNGSIYILSGAYIVGAPASSGDDGKISLEFHGVQGVWQ